MSGHIDVVFDGPPGPMAGRFVEVEDSDGRSVCFGRWLQRDDGFWVLRINDQRLDELLTSLKYIVPDLYNSDEDAAEAVERVIAKAEGQT